MSEKVIQKGRWPLEIPIGFGAASISGEGGGYGFGQMSEEEALSLVRESYDSGIRLFDTAPIYGFGLSEKRLGKALKEVREKVYLVSKCGVSWHSTKRVNMTNDPQICQDQLEESLRTLKTDYIDLYMIHWPDERVDIRETMEVLARAKEKEQIRHIGLCNTFEADLLKAQEVAKIDVVQSQLNLFETEIVDRLFPFLEKNKISFMSWGTLDKGIITGRVHEEREFDPSDCRSWAPWWKEMKKEWKYEAMRKIFKELKGMEEFKGLDLALAYNFSFAPVDCVLCGVKSGQQLGDLLNSPYEKITPALLQKCQSIVEQLRPKDL